MTIPSPRLRDSLHRAGTVPFHPPVPLDDAKRQAHELASSMSDEELFGLVVGDGFVIRGNERIGLPQIKLFDATQGVHLRETVSSGALTKTVAFPSMLCLTATWNRALVAQYARAIGEECRAGGIHVLLGPGINIYRISQNGRNFEYCGEDPFLAGDVARIYITALQQTGTMATVKHFIANNTDWCRRLSNSVVGRRALEEIYLPGFRAAVEAGVMAVMTAYNQLNGEYCGESKTVIQRLLREYLGFDGLVMTDWTSVTDGELVAESGQDLEMPEGEALLDAKETLLGSPKIRRMAESVLASCIAMGFLDNEHAIPELTEQQEAHEQVAYRTAAEGIVLLRNENDALPHQVRESETILVTGNWAVRTPLSGRGSGYVVGYNQASFFEAINNVALGANVVYRAHPTDEELESAALVVVATGSDQEGEGSDRPFELPHIQNELVSRAGALNRKTVVCLVTGGGVAMPWHDSVAAILHTFFGGQQGAYAAAAILFGIENPSGKLPFTIEVDFADSPGAGYIPEGGHPADTQPEGEHPLNRGPEHVKVDWPYRIDYAEGIYVGYRWYSAKQKPVRYWFGHGLSYTTFAYSDLSVAERRDGARYVSLTVTNTGGVAGAEVVQLYLTPSAERAADRPEQELKGYERIHLEPGRSGTVAMLLTEEDFAYFDEGAGRWQRDRGTREIRIGASYADVRLTTQIEV